MENRYAEISKKYIELSILRRMYIHKLMSGSEIYPGQLFMLEYICNHEGCTQREISENMKVTQASVALSVKRLCRVELLVKKVDESNLRCNRIYTTEKCREQIISARACIDKADEMQFSGLSETELACLESCMAKMAENLSDGEPSEFFDLIGKAGSFKCKE